VTARLLTAVLFAALGLPAAAQAHGPVDPAASSYEARVSQVPQGTDAKIVDGDLRMWMSASPTTTVIVLDYRGAPYLRFTRAGVYVNRSSAMWYLNQVPVLTPPLGLTSRTPPHWLRATGGHSYEWHDGRLHALASTARAPGATYIGRWTVPLLVGGVPTAITGGLYYAPDPSPVWFWPILVVLACVLAAVRLRRPSLDQRLARGLAAATLTAFLVAALARQLHGRPGISPGSLIVLALELAFVGWATSRMARGGGWFVLFLIAAAAIWEGATLVGTLVYGFVLLALPVFPARLVVVACLAGGVGLLPVVFVLAERPQGRRRVADAAADSLEPSL
jgi:multidrug transporter EmrE-like cation transporter